ncbi:MAG: hypothetical protein H7069_05950 [Phormidesmis sp. FL-bin-119]|nr:hypothetical protein [Pedobacter sp.]
MENNPTKLYNILLALSEQEREGALKLLKLIREREQQERAEEKDSSNVVENTEGTVLDRPLHKN